MKKGFFVVASVLPSLALSTPQVSNYEVHILKPGETLSGLLFSKNYKPLYGKNNWVAKTLMINHMTAKQAAKIKQGFPIILPRKFENPEGASNKNSKSDRVQLSQASTLRYGLVGNKISDHQNIFIDFAYYQTNSQLNSQDFKLRTNFKLGFIYEDNNKRTYKRFSYNPEFSFFVSGHGPAEFVNDSSQVATFEPTVQAFTTLNIAHPDLAFRFGPYFELLEKSNLEEDNNEGINNVNIRRDRFFNTGIQAQKVYHIDHLLYTFKAFVGSSLFSENLNNYNAMKMISTKISTDVNLTKDYFVGMYWREDYFSSSAQNNASSIGVNLKYFVK